MQSESKILVVDDKLEVLDFISEMLELFEYSSIVADNGEKALEIFKNDLEQKIKLVITDINMPGISGIELTRQLKNLNGSLPVIVMTGYGDKEMIAKKVGDEFITKPFEISAMIDLVKKYM